jgi:ISXO2-like transposase domain/Transposase zinc-ribbon domain
VTIVDFQERFSDEEACRAYLFACRWPDGFRCRRCGGGEIGAMHRRREVWQCKACGAQTSATAGTVMHATRQPLRLWFWAAYLVATHHPGISAVQLQRQLGIGRHETAWMLLHKLRRAMVAPEREPLKAEVEIDEFYLGGVEQGRIGGRKRGGKKTLVGVAIEVRGRGSGRLRLRVLKDASAASLDPFVKATTAPGTVVHTDGWRGYDHVEGLGYGHMRHSQRAAPGEHCSRGPIAPSPTSRRGFTAPIARPPSNTSPPTWTSSSFATTAAATRTPPSRRCWV